MIGRRMGTKKIFKFYHSFADGMGGFTQLEGTSAINASNQIYATGFVGASDPKQCSIVKSLGHTFFMSGDFKITCQGFWSPLSATSLGEMRVKLMMDNSESLRISMRDAWAFSAILRPFLHINNIAIKTFIDQTSDFSSFELSRESGVFTLKINGAVIDSIANTSIITFNNLNILLGLKYNSYAANDLRLGSISIEEG